MKHTAKITKPTSTERILKGEFTFENGKLSFTCSTQNVEFTEVLQAITAMRDECQRQINNQTLCPFHPNNAVTEPKQAQTGLGICQNKSCKNPATADYNGKGHFVCVSCLESLNKYFDEEYR